MRLSTTKALVLILATAAFHSPLATAQTEFPGSFVHAGLLKAQTISALYSLGNCLLKVDAMARADGSALDQLQIEYCEVTIPIDDACLSRFVEPNLSTITATGYSVEEREELNIYIGTRSARKRLEKEPPFVAVRFNRNGTLECAEKGL